MKIIILGLTILAVGLIAGLFYSWSVSVMLGMKMLPDKNFILSMQAMNRAIQNPLFFLTFMGAPILLLISCVQANVRPLDNNFTLIVAATLIYLIGVFGITAIGNIPLNNMLDGFDASQASNDQMAEIRSRFENRWNLLNNFRTVFSILAFCLLIVRLILGLKNN